MKELRMKKTMKYLRYQLIAVLFCLAAVLQAQTNVLRVASVSYPAGKTLPLAIEMDNSSDITGAQFDISVPYELALDEKGDIAVTLSSTRAATHRVVARKLTTQWRDPKTHGGVSTYHNYRIIVYSDENALFLDNQGTLLTLDLPLAGDAANGATFPIYLLENSVTLSDRNKQNVLTAQENGVVTIEMIPRPDLAPTDITCDKTKVDPNGELTVSWKVKNIGQVATEDGWNEQVSLVSVSGNLTKLLTTTYYEGKLAANASVSRQTKIQVPELLGIDGLAKVQVTIVPNEKTGEHPSLRDNNTAVSNNNLTVNKKLMLELSRPRVNEGSSQRVSCKLSRSGRWNNIRVFNITTTKDTRVEVPSSVTIPANQSGVVFYMTVNNNDVLDADSVVNISVSGDDYEAVTGRLVIVDDELPGLTVTSSKTDVQEGETFQLTVTAARPSATPIVVTLTSEDAKRFTHPSQVTIPAGKTKATIDVTAVDNDVPNLDQSYQFTASAQNYNKGDVLVMLHDNDMPVLTLTLTPNKVSEAAGVTSVAAVLTRTGKTDSKITIRLSDDANGGLYYSNKSIEMAKGVETVYFNLGPVDNSIKEGDRTYTLTAGVWVSSCSCAASGEQAGAVTAQLTVLDNDGASLSVASAASTVKEGGMTTLTITRNTTDNAKSLTVRLSSDYDSELTYEHTVTIPAGQNSVNVEVKSAKNNVSGDSHTVVFTVEAEGYGSGSCYLLVTDQTLPDAHVTAITANPAETVVGSTVTLSIVVANEGAAILPAGTMVKLYRRGVTDVQGTLRTETDIPIDGTETLLRRVTLPDEVGEHLYYVVVNEDKTVTELVYTNNTSAEVKVTARSPFDAKVSTDKKIYTQGEKVVVTGQLTGDRSLNAQAEVYFVNDGTRHTENVTTDGNGAFTLEWSPYALQSGHFIVGACYPGDKTTAEQAAFDVYGLKRVGSGYITEDVIVGDTRQGIIQLQNPGTLRLTGVKAQKVSGPETVHVEVDVPQIIDGGTNATLTYRLTASEATEGNNWEQIVVRVTTAEGVSLDLTIHYYGRNASGNLVVASQQLITTMLKDTGRDYSFIVTNNGRGNTGKISLVLPEWMSSLTGVTMPGLAQNDTATVVLRLMPTADMQLNVPVTGRIGINCENGNGTYINYNITPVSEATGTLVVDVTDEYTYYTAEAPHVAGAQVVVRNPYTNALVAQGVTGADGLFTLENLPEGYYRLHVTADKHNAYQNDILVDPGTTTTKVVTLSYNAITITWDVVETEVEDEYDIITTVVYETNVPAPVIELAMPDKIEAEQLGVGESLVFYATLTNKGLITGQNTALRIPTEAGDFTWEPMAQYEGIELAPQQSVVIPVKVTRKDPETQAARRAPGDVTCTTTFKWETEYECGPDGIMHPAGMKRVQFTTCTKESANGGDGGGGGGYGGLGGPNGGWYTIYGQETNYHPTNTNSDCRDCGAKVAKWAFDCAMSFVPGGGGCAYGMASGSATIASGEASTMDYVTTGLTGVGCTLELAAAVSAATGVGLGVAAVLEGIGTGINVLNCLLTFNYGCLPGIGGKNGGANGGLGGAIGVASGPSPRSASSRRAGGSEEPSYVTRFAEVSHAQLRVMAGFYGYYAEVFGDSLWLYNTSLTEMHNVLQAVANQNANCTVESLKKCQPENITDQMMERFVERLRNTNDYYATHTEYDNMIHASKVLEMLRLIEDGEQDAHDMGYASAEDMWATETEIFQKEQEKGSNSVCSTITLQIEQKMTMTRQAFRGTLTVYNGNTTTAMENIKLTLNVTNSKTQQVATAKEFEMHTESLNGFTGELPMDAGWKLDADNTGTATIIFIPTKYAAPEEPVEYSFGGTLSYLDPYSGLEVTRELYPVSLTVNPSPELDLTYFMQRDIFGDDALTEVVEPMVPAEFAVLINNKGYGDATNVRMVTKQPEIIENKKGLYINFEFISSQLNGQDKVLAMGESIPTEFGTIPAHQQAYAQWWLQSSLLGHFIDYDIKATHVTSYGNEDLSLLDQVTIHEMVRGFTPSLGSSSGRAFLVNDVTDAQDLPDQVYFTDGTQQNVTIALSAVATKQSDTQYLLTVTPQQAGWVYGSLLDPTVGKQKLISVTRQSDGAVVNLDNVWQTDRTLLDGKDWLYENRLHVVGKMPIDGETFVLTFAPKPDVELAVAEFVGVPKEGVVSTEQVKQLTVRFNKAIDAATFTTDDMTLACQGKQLDASKIKITKVTDTNYILDFSAISGGDGYYVLTVQTAGITDTEGFQGSTGKQASWVQYTGGKVSLTLTASPAEGGSISPASGQFDYGQNVSLTATAVEGYDFSKWMENGQMLSETAAFTYNVQGSTELTAVFTPKMYTVTIDYNTAGGTIEGGGTGLYSYGTPLSLTATTAWGWQFDGWLVDGKKQTAEAMLAYTVSKNVTIQAVFTEQPDAVVKGRVISDADGTPVGDAVVTLHNGDTRYVGTTDGYGYYQIKVEDKSLTYDVICQADGYMWSPTEQMWFDENTQTKNFTLLRGATVVLPKEGACTFSSPVAVTLSNENVKAWYLSKYDKKSFVVEALTAGSIVAGEGIILSGTAGQRVDMPEAASATPVMGNMLIGTPEAAYVVTDDNIYQMKENTEGDACFYLAAKGELVPKGRAYCQFTLSGQPATVNILWSGADLIDAILYDVTDPNTPHYDLQGRRIQVTGNDQGYKKIHIVNGRKVVMK